MGFPQPEGPTIATFFPAGIVNERLRKISLEGWYVKATFSKAISPLEKEICSVSGASCLCFSAKTSHVTRCVRTLAGVCSAWRLKRTSMFRGSA